MVNLLYSEYIESGFRLTEKYVAKNIIDTIPNDLSLDENNHALVLG
jgi:hypothetical protein